MKEEELPSQAIKDCIKLIEAGKYKEMLTTRTLVPASEIQGTVAEVAKKKTFFIKILKAALSPQNRVSAVRHGGIKMVFPVAWTDKDRQLEKLLGKSDLSSKHSIEMKLDKNGRWLIGDID